MADHKIDGNNGAGNVDLIEKSTKRQHFTDVRHVTVRWEPYKPDGARQMKAKGRWQEQVGTGDYFRWQNCNRPAFAHDPETTEDLTAQLAAANARADQARDNALVEAASMAFTIDADAFKKRYQAQFNRKRYDVDSVLRCQNRALNIQAEDARDAILALRDKPAPDPVPNIDRAKVAEINARFGIGEGKLVDLDKPAPAQCCMCGKTDLSTVEGDGGPECQLDDGRWTCSRACYDRATEEPAPAVTVREAANIAECAFDDRPLSRAGHHSEMDWTDGYRDGTRAAAAALRAIAPPED